MQQLPQPVKLYYIGPMFRRERPQKGRYRQFYQIGAEVLGGQDAPAIDAELIEMLMTFFDKLELKGIELDINSIGHNAENCRRAYVELLRAELRKVKDKLGADSQRRIDTNPLRVLDSKLEFEQAIIANAPAHRRPSLRRLRSPLRRRKTPTRTPRRHLPRKLAPGPRPRLLHAHDVRNHRARPGLAKRRLRRRPLRRPGRTPRWPANERHRLRDRRRPPDSVAARTGPHEAKQRASNIEPRPVKSRQSLDVYIAWMGEHAYATAVRAAKDLRNAGFSVELPPTELKFGKALGQADKLGAKYALILGDNEVSRRPLDAENSSRRHPKKAAQNQS